MDSTALVVQVVSSFIALTPVFGFAPSIDLSTNTPEPTSTTPDPDTLPYFPDESHDTTMVVPVGRDALMPCRVLRLGDRMVSWVKRDKDKLHLITFGTNTYVSSSRFSVFHDNPDTWELGISPVLKQDDGVYVCQVSVHPPIGFTITLKVTTPVLKITDDRGNPIDEKFYEVKSSIDLQCVASGPDTTPVWVKTGPHYNTTSSTTNTTDFETGQHVSGGATSVSWLKITSATKNDSGIYTCTADDAQPATVRVHVLDGENSVAMQHSTNSAMFSSISWLVMLTSVSISICIFYISDVRNSNCDIKFYTLSGCISHRRTISSKSAPESMSIFGPSRTSAPCEPHEKFVVSCPQACPSLLGEDIAKYIHLLSVLTFIINTEQLSTFMQKPRKASSSNKRRGMQRQ